MASRRGDTFDKRQRERRRQEKAAEKRARRQGIVTTAAARPAQNNAPSAPKTTAELDAMEKFRVLSEHHAAGGIDTETFEFMRDEIFAELGIDAPQ